MKKYYKGNFNGIATKIGETPVMNEKTVFPQILESHMAPKGKWGKVVVINGELNYKWHDEDTIYTVDSENPLVIEPERLHHIILTGNVEFKVEFYKVDSEIANNYDEKASRPGENFI